MLQTLAINNYRSLLELIVPLRQLNLITGPNGSGKSNFYRALRLLAETAQGGVVNALAYEGGLDSTYWAGPENVSRHMQEGDAPVQTSMRNSPKRLQLGFAGEDFGYAISLGLPIPSQSAFSLDPEIKRECIWAGAAYRPASALVDRNGPLIKVRTSRSWKMLDVRMGAFDSIFSMLADPDATPEIFKVREWIRSWRFYDHFRSDREAPARLPQLGTRTPVLHHDGHDLAAALQTIREIGDAPALDQTVADAFPGAHVEIAQSNNRFMLLFHQRGLLRPLTGTELSDGTLRYLLWVAVLLSPRPPSLMVLNEPETSLHPDLLPALARLIVSASAQTQVWVVSHAAQLIEPLRKHQGCAVIELEKNRGQSLIKGQRMVDQPSWHWPA